MTKKQEVEFLKLAGFMLLCRWQLMGNETEEWAGKSPWRNKRFYMEMSYLGYTDTVAEMKLFLKELQQISLA